jgi:hypothetical protein
MFSLSTRAERISFSVGLGPASNDSAVAKLCSERLRPLPRNKPKFLLGPALPVRSIGFSITGKRPVLASGVVEIDPDGVICQGLGCPAQRPDTLNHDRPIAVEFVPLPWQILNPIPFLPPQRSQNLRHQRTGRIQSIPPGVDVIELY